MDFSYNRGFGYYAARQFQRRLEEGGHRKPHAAMPQWGGELSRALTFYCKDVEKGKKHHTLLQGWEALTHDTLSAWDPLSLSASFHSFAKIGYQPAEPWYAGWAEASRERMDAFDGRGLSSLIYGHALLGKIPDAAWYARWEAKLCEQVERLDVRELSNIFYALAVCKAGGMDVDGAAGRIWEALGKLPHPLEKPSQLFQQYHALRVFDWPVPYEIQKEMLFAKLEVSTSPIEKRVMQVLSEMQQEGRVPGGAMRITALEKEVRHPTTLTPVDFAVTLKVKRRKEPVTLYMEVDGESHFVLQPDGSVTNNGATLMRDYLQSKPQQGIDTCRVTLSQVTEQNIHAKVAEAIVGAVSAVQEPRMQVSEVDSAGRIGRRQPAQAVPVAAKEGADKKRAMGARRSPQEEGGDRGVMQR